MIMNNLLLVDDETSVNSALKRSLLEEPFEIRCVNNGFDALKILGSEKFKVLISDEMMPGMDGAELLSIVREQAVELMAIEWVYPGISRLEKDKSGNLLLPEFASEEIAEIILQCLEIC
jgi:DNA-binding NtrC family response regulator